MSSSDEAPEEVTFNESKLAQRLQEKKRKQAEDAARQTSKQKRRDRDLMLKQQQQASQKKKASQKKLLSELLQEEGSDDDEETQPTDGPQGIESKPAVVRAPVREKKTFAIKDGYTVKVQEPSRVTKKKKLPPAGSSAVSRREQFLFRESVPRK